MTLDIITGKIKLLSPLSHLGNEKTGSVSMLNRQKWLVDGESLQIPFVSGNAVRGILRRKIMRDMIKLLDYEINLNDKKGKKLFHALFTGGVLESVSSKDSGVINLELKRKIYDTIPASRLFGFAFGNQMIESLLAVGQVIPICTELKEYIPDTCDAKMSFRNMLSDTFQTRRDDIREARESDESVTQMMIDYEVFVPGSTFHHEFRLEDATELDRSTFARVIELWNENPILGGKSRIGMGRLKLDYDMSDYKTDKYFEFMKTKKSEIIKTLDELQEL